MDSSNQLNTNNQNLQNGVSATTQASASQGSNSKDSKLTDKVHPDDLDARWNNWKCLECGYVYEGVRAKTTCPKCGNSDPDRFGDV